MAMSSSLTTPYYVAHQRLLVPTASGVDGVEDLAGETVCASIDPEVQVDLEDLDPSIEVVDASSWQRCVQMLMRGTAAAATASDVVLMTMRRTLEGFSGESYAIVGDQLNTEAYAAVVRPEATGMVGFLNGVLSDTFEDGRWVEAYDETVAPLGDGSEPVPPELNLAQAATLFPAPPEPTPSG